MTRRPPTIACLILLIALAAVGSRTLLSRSTLATIAQETIVVNDSDYASTLTTMNSSDLDSAAQIVAARITTENLDFGSGHGLQGSDALNQNTTAAQPRIFIEYADFALSYGLWPPYHGPQPVSDSTPPTIDAPSQDPPPHNVTSTDQVKVSVNVTDTDSGVETVVLSYNNGTVWNLTMTYNFNSRLYETMIPRQQYDTQVEYSISARDFAANSAVNDNASAYFVYQVIPEYAFSPILPILIVSTLIAVTVYKTRSIKRLHAHEQS